MASIEIEPDNVTLFLPPLLETLPEYSSLKDQKPRRVKVLSMR
jgi:hypothetical protein